MALSRGDVLTGDGGLCVTDRFLDFKTFLLCNDLATVLRINLGLDFDTGTERNSRLVDCLTAFRFEPDDLIFTSTNEGIQIVVIVDRRQSFFFQSPI